MLFGEKRKAASAGFAYRNDIITRDWEVRKKAIVRLEIV